MDGSNECGKRWNKTRTLLQSHVERATTQNGQHQKSARAVKEPIHCACLCSRFEMKLGGLAQHRQLPQDSFFFFLPFTLSLRHLHRSRRLGEAESLSPLNGSVVYSIVRVIFAAKHVEPVLEYCDSLRIFNLAPGAELSKHRKEWKSYFLIKYNTTTSTSNHYPIWP